MNYIFVIKIDKLNPFRKLLGETAIYGLSSIVGRFLNWLLVPYYSVLFLPGEFGVVTNLLAYEAFLIIFLTYGMETGYFRFASRTDDAVRVYSTSQMPLLITSTLFMAVALLFAKPIATTIGYADHPEYIRILAAVGAIDAFTAIPFAKLRLDNRPIKFATIKIINIGLNIGFNLFFLSLCPFILKHFPDSPVRWVYSPDIGVGYVFISYLIASISTLLLLYKEIFSMQLKIDVPLLKKILSYSFPILIIGIAGMVNQNIDKILIPVLVPQDQDPMYQVGIYGANFKLALLMNMFIQAFRYAFEPFFFSRSSSSATDDPKLYAVIMKYFVVFGLIIFLGMTLFIDIVKLAIDSKFHEGIKVVPLVLMANLLFGIFFNLSIWYKIKDMTRYGAYIALIGAVITLVLNILLIPSMGYMGSAVAVLICFIIMSVITYIWGQKHYFVPYDLKRIAIYFVIALGLFFISKYAGALYPSIKLIINSFLMLLFFLVIFKLEKTELLQILKRNKG